MSDHLDIIQHMMIKVIQNYVVNWIFKNVHRKANVNLYLVA